MKIASALIGRKASIKEKDDSILLHVYQNKKVKEEKIESIIFHKSSCITCKKTISELDRMKIDIQKRDFFKEPFSERELQKIITLLGLNPNELLRKRDKMYKELDLDNIKLSESKIIKLMVKYPGLIRRPIIIKKNKGYVGKLDVKNLK